MERNELLSDTNASVDGLGVARWGGVLLAPLAELTQDGYQRLAGVRQEVLIARWVLAVAPAGDDARVFELA